MNVAELASRLAALPNLSEIPRPELEWLAGRGRYEQHTAGTVVAPKGRRVPRLWILLSGHIAVRVDRGAGPRRVMGWRTGEVSGMLPYSRMTGPPGDNFCEEPTELLTIDRADFPDLIVHCPVFTAYTVHLMLDRARGFTSSDLHDEKMISLGRMAAGLAHELNNPASAALRSAKQLRTALTSAAAASHTLGALELTGPATAAIEQIRAICRATVERTARTAMQRSDREDALADWLAGRGCDTVHADVLARSDVTMDQLDGLAAALPGAALAAAVDWIATGAETERLSREIERALTRVHDLVAAVKRFTYMDHLAGPEQVDVGEGLADTIRVLASKAEARRAAVVLDVEANLPRVRATGGDLNQVWLVLVDNALDAISDAGRIEVSAGRELDRVVVRVADNGPGIPPDVMPWIFDPFFTTKPPGQGTGLGLDIARRLARRYRGDITATSEAGRTEFRVSLPAEPAPAG